MIKLINKRTISAVLFLLTAFLVVLGFQSYSSSFSQQSLKGITVQKIHEDSNLQSVKEYFPLSNSESIQLAAALKSNNELAESLNTTYQYRLVLHNKLGLTKEYMVLFTPEQEVFLVDQQKTQLVTKVAEPNFFFNHGSFSQIYSERLDPVIKVNLNNEEKGLNPIEAIQWSYLKYNGQWTSNSQQREITDSSSVAITSSKDQLKVFVDKEPDQAYIKIVEPSTGSVVLEDRLDNLSQLPLPKTNGNFLYKIEMDWLDETRPFRGHISMGIPVTTYYPEIFTFSKSHLIQGDILEVTLYNADNLEDIIFEQSIFNKFRWYLQADGIARGYIPTNFSVKPGIYPIKYGNRQKGTETIEEIEVVAHSYRIQHLTISREIEQSTRNDAAYAEFAKYFTPVRQESPPVRYYSDTFVIPTKGRLTTEFGQTRYINGAPTSSRHSGLDIAAPTGTPIRATNCGKVVLSMSLILTGNTIVIDHGEGLFSVYYHNHENLVSVGEMVERGQKIATVGTTGFSTGPHLHFTMSYYTTNIEPGFLLVGKPITVANYREFLQN